MNNPTTPLTPTQPCPFCGSLRIVKGERYFAMCVDCGTTGPERNSDATERKFVGDWNTRYANEQSQQELAKLRQQVEGLKQDAKRLDWLEKKVPSGTFCTINNHQYASEFMGAAPKEWSPETPYSVGDYSDSFGNSLRTAIDAAIEKERGV